MECKRGEVRLAVGGVEVKDDAGGLWGWALVLGGGG